MFKQETPILEAYHSHISDSLHEEIKQELILVAPLIIFFGLSADQQTVILPRLEQEDKYDFLDGDLITNNALEVLINGYNKHLNFISIRFIGIANEFVNENSQAIVDLIEKLLEFTHIILEGFTEIEDDSNFKTPKWNSIRTLSLTLQQKTGIPVGVNKYIMRKCVEYWQHS